MKKLFLVLAVILAGCEDSSTKNESSDLTFISTNMIFLNNQAQYFPTFFILVAKKL